MSGEEAVTIRVGCYAGYRGEETPTEIVIEESRIQLVGIVDRWLAPDHRYFKATDAAGDIYILRHDVTADRWELTSYQSARICTAGSLGRPPLPLSRLARKTRIMALALCVVAASCGGSDGPQTPMSPTPPTPPGPPASPTWSLSGSVRTGDPAAPVRGGRVEVVDGEDAGRSAVTGDDGRFLLEGLRQGQFSVRASAESFEPQTRQISLTSNLVADFTLSPTPGPAPVPPPRVLSGSILDGLSDIAIPGATLDIEGLGAVTTTADGTFRIEASDPEQIRSVTIRASSVVERRTSLRVPGPDARLRLIPSSFDLTAFDQMFRSSGPLQRWIEAPRLTIQTRVLRFTTTSATEVTAIDGLMTDADANLLREDLGWALGQLTAATFSSFANTTTETAAVGAVVRLTRTGEIVVARFEGLQAATGFWGFSRWATNGNGTVVGGIIMLDRGFETSGSPFRRSLRAHELGHALGYTHVTSRVSVMNASGRVEPNDFDLNAVKLAFLRPPGNRSPDRDPDSLTSNLLSGAIIWATGSH